MRTLLLFLSIFASTLQAQQRSADDPIPLDQVMKFLPEPGLQGIVEGLIESVRLSGLGFDLDESSLGIIVGASYTGKRDPQLVARLILLMIQSCPDCRKKYFGPWSKADLITILNNKKITLSVLQQELQFRGIIGIPKTMQSIQDLKQSNVPPELINLIVPNDEILIPIPSGYKQERLRRADEYDTKLTTGSVSLLVKVSGKAEFFLKHNALFTKVEALPNTDKKIKGKVETPATSVDVLLATFTTPIPQISGIADFEVFNALDKPAARGRTKVETLVPQFSYVDGGVKFEISDKDPHMYEIRIRYRIPPTSQMK